MSENEEVLCRFGTQLGALEEDEVPTKKPIAIEDQIVTDSNGKRRFHGAFTGGFSAGFWNTVGSLEGWKPQQYKSSRMEKAESKVQKPTDFMDEEDLGEFGIAPQRIQTTEDFSVQKSNSTGNLRKRPITQSLGPIPGIPVLEQLLQPAKENVAIRLLKKMGWKMGQGIGARQTRGEKKAASKKIASEQYLLKKYGCEMGPLESERIQSDDTSESEHSDDEITYAPQDYEQLFCGLKDNVFGLGYKGLNENLLQQNAQHIDLFRPFELMSKNNKKLSIRGQAFGVGALEEEDEDIYAKEDMTKYDFSLNDRQKLPKKPNLKDDRVLDGFHARQDENLHTKIFEVDLPETFKPRKWGVRKSRFEPLDDDKAIALKKQNEHKRMGLGRHDLKPHERRNILENVDKSSSKTDINQSEGNIEDNYLQKINQKYKDRESKTANVLSFLETNKSKFTTGGLFTIDGTQVINPDDTEKEENKLREKCSTISESGDISNTVFKPFLFDERKQNRYDKYLKADLKTDEEITSFLKSVQPLEMSDWDKEMEKKEFIQARKIYKPLKGLMSDRFITEGSFQVNKATKEKSVEPKKTEIIRTKITWHPCSLLCKRFNVAELFLETKIENNSKKKSHFSVFDYIEAPINTKKDFVTPVIIPYKVAKTKEIISQNENSSTANQRKSTKELFIQDMQKCNLSNNKDMSDSGLSLMECVKYNNDQTTSSTPGSTAGIDEVSKIISKRSTYKKTELEKQIEALKNEHPSEKKDLFKAIFETSSDDDDEISNERSDFPSHTKNQNLEKDENIKLVSSELNILRNTSPPRGIFAYLFSKNKEQTTKNNESTNTTETNENNSKEKAEKEDELRINRIAEESKSEYYGPAIPTVGTRIEHSTSSPEKEDIDGKLVKLLTKSTKSARLVEEWIEKGAKKKDKKVKKGKKKKSKKHKKKNH